MANFISKYDREIFLYQGGKKSFFFQMRPRLFQRNVRPSVYVPVKAGVQSSVGQRLTKTAENDRFMQKRLGLLHLNPAVAHRKGLVKIILYMEVFIIAKIWITGKMVLETKICMLSLPNYVKSGCASAGFLCTTLIRDASGI